MSYCLPLGVDSNMKERSDRIFESMILSSLKCIPILYDIIELILKMIHNRKQDQNFGIPNAVGYQNFVCVQESLRILARILIYQKFLLYRKQF